MQTNLLPETFPKTDPEIVKLGAEVRRLMTEAMKRSGKNAKEVAKEMSDRLGGRPVTQGMIYELTRSGEWDQPRGMRLQPAWIPVFCEVTGDDRLRRLLAGPRLRELIELGERVCTMEPILRQALDAVARLRNQRRGKEAQGKETRKA